MRVGKVPPQRAMPRIGTRARVEKSNGETVFAHLDRTQAETGEHSICGAVRPQAVALYEHVL